MPTTAKLTIDGRVARLVFSNPEGLNILDAGCRASLEQCLEIVEGHGALRLLVLSAVGKVFLAGADLKELASLDRHSALAYATAGQAIANRIEALPLVTLISIHGACAGGGCELALACDLRIANASARIGLPETTLGLIPGWGGTYRARRDLGLSRAKQVILSAKLFPADEAASIGLLHRVVADDQLVPATEAWQAELLTRGPLALVRAKTILHSPSPDRAAHLAAEAQAFAACYDTGEPREGLAAFFGKRPAAWDAAASGS